MNESAVTRVFAIAELVERILLHAVQTMRVDHFLLLQKVNRRFRDTIIYSPTIPSLLRVNLHRRELCLFPDWPYEYYEKEIEKKLATVIPAFNIHVGAHTMVWVRSDWLSLRYQERVGELVPVPHGKCSKPGSWRWLRPHFGQDNRDVLMRYTLNEGCCVEEFPMIGRLPENATLGDLIDMAEKLTTDCWYLLPFNFVCEECGSMADRSWSAQSGTTVKPGEWYALYTHDKLEGWSVRFQHCCDPSVDAVLRHGGLRWSRERIIHPRNRTRQE